MRGFVVATGPVRGEGSTVGGPGELDGQGGDVALQGLELRLEVVAAGLQGSRHRS